MKIVVLDGFTLNPGDLSWKELKNLVSDLVVYDRTEPRLIINRIGDADIILVNKVSITNETIDACPNLKFIGVMATGYNTIDAEYAQKKKIIVSNVPAYSTSAVTQHVFAMIFAITNHIHEHSQSVKSGEWQHSVDFAYWKYPLVEVAEKTMGIIGLGQIGRNVAFVAKAFGMNVIACGSGSEAKAVPDGIKIVPRDELFAKADIISLHCPLTAETTNLIRRETIQKMKRGVIIINTARGKIINEQELASALSNGQVAYAAVDVLSEEPPRGGSPLIDNPKCFLTPHIAWAPLESRMRCMQITLENIKAFLDNHPKNLVNFL